MSHELEWATSCDLPTTLPILQKIFGGLDAFCTWGMGGDACLPGAFEYQGLHSDIKETFEMTEERKEAARRVGATIEEVEELGIKRLTDESADSIYRYTPPLVTVNFFMTDLTWENGPIRQIPGTQTRRDPPFDLKTETDSMRFSTLVGGTAGSCVIRDNRAWHGGTPNISKEIRAMPNVEYQPLWFHQKKFFPTMPEQVYSTLSPTAQQLCRKIIIKPQNKEILPKVGVLHPIKNKRRG